MHSYLPNKLGIKNVFKVNIIINIKYSSNAII